MKTSKGFVPSEIVNKGRALPDKTYSDKGILCFRKQNLKRSRVGFSLTEVLIVLAFMATMSAIGLGYYFNFHRQTILNTTLDEMVAFLYEAQQRSIGQHEASQWGVRFTNPTSGTPFYSSFRGAFFTSPVETRSLDRTLDFSLPADGQSIDIIFNRINGRILGGLPQEIRVRLNPGTTIKAVRVSPIGVISRDN